MSAVTLFTTIKDFKKSHTYTRKKSMLDSTFIHFIWYNSEQFYKQTAHYTALCCLAHHKHRLQTSNIKIFCFNIPVSKQ